MQAEIITIGDEILIGQITDTNSMFISKELNKIGVSVYQISSVQDDRQHILDALQSANQRSQLVLLTGGLGPTKDDITKHTLCEFFKDSLVENKAVLAHIEHLFKKYIATPISEMNRLQALVPIKAEVLHNAYGTAPGLWMEKEGTVFVSMPGVPFEMKQLMRNHVIPKVMEQFQRPHILHRTIMTYGLGESAIAERIAHWEENLPKRIKLAYLPNLGRVRLRLSTKGTDKNQLESMMEKALATLFPLINDIVFGEEADESIELTIANLLTAKNYTLATAESFTGGKLSASLTAIPGASKYFKGTLVGYATQAKIEVLGVPKTLVEEHTVVSEAVACEMAQRAKELFRTDFAIATTGNAGPEKGDSQIDVGTVFIAIATPKGTFAQQFTMGNHRERVVQKSVNKAFELLQKEIMNF